MNRSIRVFTTPNENKKRYQITFDKQGDSTSFQYLRLEEMFSNNRPFISLQNVVIKEVYINSRPDSDGNVFIYKNNNLLLDIPFSDSKFQLVNESLLVNDTLSVAISPNPLIRNIIVTVILEYGQ